MTYQEGETGLPAHSSPFLSATSQHPSKYIHNLNLNELDNHRVHGHGVPDNLISPAFTPPLTPTRSGARTPSGDEHLHKEPESFPVDTALDDPENTQRPKLLQELPKIECVVRARIPTTSGAEMFLHLYTNDTDNKEHLAIVFGNSIRSRSLDAEKPGETEMDRMIRGAYIGRLTPGRTSSRLDPKSPRPKQLAETRARGSSLKNVTVPEDLSLDNSNDATKTTPSHPSTLSSSLSPDDISPPNSQKSSTNSSTPPSEPTRITTPEKSKSSAPLVRIHSECYTGETAWSARCDCGEQLDEAARLMSLPSVNPHPGGVIVYLRQEGRGIGLASKLKAYNLQDLGNDTVEANLLLRHPADARTYGLATAILQDLGLGTDEDEKKPTNERGIRLLTNNPDKVRAVEGNNREVRVVERVAMVPIAWTSGGMKGVKGAEIEKYLQTKIGRMGHMLER